MESPETFVIYQPDGRVDIFNDINKAEQLYEKVQQAALFKRTDEGNHFKETQIKFKSIPDSLNWGE